MERTINIAVTQEKSRRLELELELRKQKEIYERSPFSPSEEIDFRYIYKMINKPLELVSDLWARSKQGDRRIRKEAFRVSYFGSIIYYLNKGYNNYADYRYIGKVKETFKENGFPKDMSDTDAYYGDTKVNHDIAMELLTFGLTKAVEKVGYIEYQFTEKMYRFHYWLGYNNLIKDKIDVEYLGPVETKDKSNNIIKL